MQKLNGANGVYVFDPESNSNLLRKGGKFGNTYIGVNESTNEKCVIKHLITTNERNIQLFKTEAQIKIAHPYIAQVIDFIELNGNYFLIRKFIEGTTIDNYLKQNRFNNKQRIAFVLKCVSKLLDILTYVHSQGIIHRDIRPANILISNDEVYLIDFGLAKVLSENDQSKTPFALIYSPPEQLLNRAHLVNETSDCYALAVTLYELVTGQKPFNHPNPEVLMNLQLTHPLPRHSFLPNKLHHILSTATPPPAFKFPPNKYTTQQLDELIEQAQQLRFQSADAFKNALNNYTPPKSFFSLLSPLFKKKQLKD